MRLVALCCVAAALLVSSTQSAPTATPTPAPGDLDRAVLVALYNATDGPNWENNSNWLSGAPIGEWYGVTADDSGRVTKLGLYNNQLRGEIPPELGSLVNLTGLFLGSNQLSGEIPPELGSLSNLERLFLSNNQLTGEIPSELGSLPSLTRLYLGNNQLTGCIPEGLRDVSRRDFSSLDLPFCMPAATPTPSPGDLDRAVLVALYNATDGPNWENNSNWLSDAPIGEWHGVTTDNRGRVTSLHLIGNRLRAGRYRRNWAASPT